MVRNSLNYAGWNKRKEVIADLRLAYSEGTLAEAEMALLDFEPQCMKYIYQLPNPAAPTGSTSLRSSTNLLRSNVQSIPRMPLTRCI